MFFYQNLSFQPVTVKIPDGCSQTIAGFHLLAVVKKFAINKTFELRVSCARIFGIFKQGATTSLVAYGPPGSQILLRLAVRGKILSQAKSFKKESAIGDLTLRVKVPTAGPDIYSIKTAHHILRVFVESREAMYHTWFVNIGGRPALVCGPDYVGRTESGKGHMALHTQMPLADNIRQSRIYFGNSSKPISVSAVAGPRKAANLAVPAFAPWQVRLADGPANPKYDDKSWISAPNPVQMGVGDYPGLHQWYRSKITVKRAGAYRILFSHLAGAADVFVNGILAQVGGRRAVNVRLKAGVNELAILAGSSGRPKLWTYIGPYNKVGAMGISGKAILTKVVTENLVVKNWKYRYLALSKSAAMVRVLSDLGGGPFNKLNHGVIPEFKKHGFIWLRAKMSQLNADHLVLSWQHPLSNAFICFDAGRVDLHAIGTDPARAMLTFWYGKQPNILSILIPANAMHSLGRVVLSISRLAPAVSGGGAIPHWRMRGGMGSPFSKAGWKHFTKAQNVPCFYRTAFTWNPKVNPQDQLHVVMRVAWGDLTGGYMWLNGHNLGHYPDTIMRMGLYIPSCYLKRGANELIVSDQEGHSPVNTRLVVEKTASRWYATLASK